MGVIVVDGHRNAGEQLALVLSEYGMQRMNARMIALFLVTEQETLTQGQIAEELGAGAGSVSAAIRAAIDIGMVERVPAAGSRREHYRLRDEAWATLFTRQNHAIEAVLAAARRAIDATEAGTPARRRLEDMVAFYEFMLAELPTLLERWRAARRSERHDA